MMTEQNKKDEENYKRGFAQGFQVGIQTQPENFDEMKNKINEWRYSDSTKGAPGTPYEEHVFYKENKDPES